MCKGVQLQVSTCNLNNFNLGTGVTQSMVSVIPGYL